MEETPKVPAIRFRGFTDAWEHRKLGDVVDITMGQSPSSLNYTDNPRDYILVQGNADMKNGRVFPRVWTTQSTKKAEKNDLILSVRAPVGDVGKTDFDVVLGRGVAGIKGNEFIFHLLTRMKKNEYWRNLSTGSTFESINSAEINDANVLIPNNKEQIRIGLFLKGLDHLITLHQRKLSKLKNIKKSMLDKLFTKEGQDTPDLRFAGFTDAWEQRKLGEVGDFTSNGVDKLISPDEPIVNLLNYMDVYNRREITSQNCTELMQVTAKPAQLKNNNVLAGDVFFTPTSETADDIGHALVIEENLLNTVYSYHLMRFRPYDGVFYITYPNYGFDTRELHSQMSIKAKGVQRFVISKPDFENLEVTHPIYKEQECIAKFFGSLDRLITLHQRKLDKLQNVKKSLLEKMFV